jgi:hypothetical protein
MEFDPGNNVIALCVQGMGIEDKGKPEEASRLFLQAWNEATNDFESLPLLIMWPDIKRRFATNCNGSKHLCGLH